MTTDATPIDPKDAHENELNWRRAYVNALSTASYFWAIEKDGKIVLSEYDQTCECSDATGFHPTGHLHLKSEWPAAPFVLHAIPETLDHQDLPAMSVPIAAGEEAIFERRVYQRFYKNPVQKDPAVPVDLEDPATFTVKEQVRHEDYQLLGVRHADGSEEVVVVAPDGQHQSVNSLAAAYAIDPGALTGLNPDGSIDFSKPSDHPNDIRAAELTANHEAEGAAPLT